jgi:hypothetical protein
MRARTRLLVGPAIATCSRLGLSADARGFLSLRCTARTGMPRREQQVLEGAGAQSTPALASPLPPPTLYVSGLIQPLIFFTRVQPYLNRVQTLSALLLLWHGPFFPILGAYIQKRSHDA